MKMRSFTETFITSKNFKVRLGRGGMVLVGGGGVGHGLRFLRNIILTRMLAPEAFGIMAILVAANSLFNVFTGIGIKEAVVQNPNAEEPTYLNGAWWLSFARSIFLYAIAYLSAPLIAQIYESSDLIDLLRFAFLAPVIYGALSPRAYLAIKQMKYLRWIMITQGGGICGILATIILAFVLKGVWALVIGFVIESVAQCLLSFLICPFKPGLNFRKEHVKSLLQYAKGMIGLPVLTFIFGQTDIFVIGKICSNYSLGLYAIALSFARIPTLLVGTIIHPLLMPAFAEFQNDNNKINNLLLKTTASILYIGFPLLLFLTFYGKELLSFVYGSQYKVVAIPFAILFSRTLMVTCSTPLTSVYLAIGQPALQRRFSAIRALLLLLFIYPAVSWFGLIGAAAAPLLALLIAFFFFQVRRMSKLTELDVPKYCSIFIRAFFISLPVATIWVSTYTFLSPDSIANVFAVLLGCFFIYSLLALIAFRSKKIRQLIWI